MSFLKTVGLVLEHGRTIVTGVQQLGNTAERIGERIGAWRIRSKIRAHGPLGRQGTFAWVGIDPSAAHLLAQCRGAIDSLSFVRGATAHNYRNPVAQAEVDEMAETLDQVATKYPGLALFVIDLRPAT